MRLPESNWSGFKKVGSGYHASCISIKHAVANSRAIFENNQCNNIFTANAVISVSAGILHCCHCCAQMGARPLPIILPCSASSQVDTEIAVGMQGHISSAQSSPVDEEYEPPAEVDHAARHPATARRHLPADRLSQEAHTGMLLAVPAPCMCTFDC